jgi:hypothetical protein
MVITMVFFDHHNHFSTIVVHCNSFFDHGSPKIPLEPLIMMSVQRWDEGRRRMMTMYVLKR